MNNNEILTELKNIKQTMLQAELVKGQYMLWDLIEKIEQDIHKLEEKKMMKITLGDGSVYIGANEPELIMQLKLEDWTRYNNPVEYKENIVRRIANFNGEKIIYSSDFEFLRELQRVGFIKSIEKI